MDIPFHSSGAASRAHYSIVRKVESSPSIQTADQYIALEIKSIQAQIYDPKLSLKKCKECLIILLYCANSVSSGFLPKDVFDFAFPHAINLTESATKIEEKRLGYLFCAEIMPMDHELRLMLINTLRKDLESDDVPRICLALEGLITSPSEDILPAVQSRLHDLLSHDHAHVRRRALFAFRSLSCHDDTLLNRIHGSILTRLKDSDASVVEAALLLAEGFPDDKTVSARINKMLKTGSSGLLSNPGILARILKYLGDRELAGMDVSVLFDILVELTRSKKYYLYSKPLILDLFRLLAQLHPSILLKTEKAKNVSIVQTIRHLLISRDPNDVYIFIRCLEAVDPSLWAGTAVDHPSVLDGLEFERILNLLDSSDQAIRRRTLRIINKVDPTILDARLNMLMKTNYAATERKEYITRISEVAAVRYTFDGDGYARQVIDLIQHLDNGGSSTQVIKELIEVVLTHIRSSSTPKFQESCTNRFIVDVLDQTSSVGPTSFTITAALATEFFTNLAIAPLELLSAFTRRLKSCAAIVQEPCLIAMMRIRANCDEIPPEITETVNEISQSARRLIRQRCQQFLGFAVDKSNLLEVVKGAKSSSLPDFLASLLQDSSAQPNNLASSSDSPPNSPSSFRTSRPPSSLKYAAYDAAEATPSLRGRRVSTSQLNAPSFQNDVVSDHSQQNDQPHLLPANGEEPLALVEGLNNLQIPREVEQTPPGDSKRAWQTGIEAARVDLINLESPFQVDESAGFASPLLSDKQEDFESVWSSYDEACDLRGWVKGPIDSLMRRLQRVEGHYLRVISADLAPFIGELKVLMIADKKSGTSSPIAVRLRETEDDSCLWRLRCSEVAAGERIQTMLNE